LTLLSPFIVVRHGQTRLGAEGRFQGHLPVGLDETGLRQAEEAGRKLAGLVAHGGNVPEFSQIVASDLPRALETAHFIASHLGMPDSAVVKDSRLREMAFGAWEGMTTLEVKERFPDLRRARKKDRWNFAAPGGESYADLAERVASWLRQRECSTIIVAHSGTIRVMGYLVGAWGAERALAEKIAYCEMWSWKNNEFMRL